MNKQIFFAKSSWLFFGSVKHYWKIVSTIEIEFSSYLGDPFEKFWLLYVSTHRDHLFWLLLLNV